MSGQHYILRSLTELQRPGLLIIFQSLCLGGAWYALGRNAETIAEVDGALCVVMQITQPTNCRMMIKREAKHPRNHAVLPHICVNLNNLGLVTREPPKIPPETMMSGYKILRSYISANMHLIHHLP
jgi:hypothetical protein